MSVYSYDVGRLRSNLVDRELLAVLGIDVRDAERLRPVLANMIVHVSSVVKVLLVLCSDTCLD